MSNKINIIKMSKSNDLLILKVLHLVRSYSTVPGTGLSVFQRAVHVFCLSIQSSMADEEEQPVSTEPTILSPTELAGDYGTMPAGTKGGEGNFFRIARRRRGVGDRTMTFTHKTCFAQSGKDARSQACGSRTVVFSGQGDTEENTCS